MRCYDIKSSPLNYKRLFEFTVISCMFIHSGPTACLLRKWLFQHSITHVIDNPNGENFKKYFPVAIFHKCCIVRESMFNRSYESVWWLFYSCYEPLSTYFRVFRAGILILSMAAPKFYIYCERSSHFLLWLGGIMYLIYRKRFLILSYLRQHLNLTLTVGAPPISCFGSYLILSTPAPNLLLIK